MSWSVLICFDGDLSDLLLQGLLKIPLIPVDSREVRLESSWSLGDLLAGIVIEECELRNYIIKIYQN